MSQASPTNLNSDSTAIAGEKKNGRTRLIFLILGPGVLALVAAIVYLLGGRFVSTDNAYVKADLISISSQVSGVVVERAVVENQHVHKGQLLYRLDDQPYRIALTKAEAHLAEVRTNLLSLKASYRERESDLLVAQKNAAFALQEKNRQENLAQKHLVAEASFDQVKHTSVIAKQQISGVQQDLKRIAETLGGKVSDSLETHPTYLAAVAELDQAKLNLEHIQVLAPEDGTVTRPPELGEYVNQGVTTMTLVSSNHIWVSANFVETDLTHVKPGQKVDVHIDTYPDYKWEGRVQSLSPATGAEFSLIPAQNATGNWVKIAQRVPVKISLNENPGAPNLQAGLSAEIKIDTEHQRKFLGISL